MSAQAPGPAVAVVDTPRRRPDCTAIEHIQNAAINDRCGHKVNRLSCRCSGCETDDRYPVLATAADAPLLNTAYDGSGGFLTSGTDPHWEVGLGQPNDPTSVPAAGWIPAFVVVNSQLINPNPPGAWTNSPFANAGWISYYQDGAQSGNNEDAYFRYRFNLASSVNPSTFALTMDFYADNQAAEIYVNGVAQSTQPNGSGVLPQVGFPLASDPYSTSGFGPKSAARITLDNSWRRCDNEIVVYVRSGSPYLGFLAQNAVRAEADTTGCECRCDCTDLPLPDVHPCISVAWGDSACDCMETDDVEVLCITVCNCYPNVTFTDFSIGQILVTDMAGNPVPNLPNGTPSVQVIPSGPICFGDVPPCTDKDHPGCVSREVVLYTRGAVGKDYRLTFNGICFSVCLHFQSEQCFTFKLCQD